MDTRNRLASNVNEGLVEDAEVVPARLASKSDEDAASDDD